MRGRETVGHGTLHTSLEDAKTALSIALMHEALKWNAGMLEFDIIWDDLMRARCVVRSFDVNGNKGLWMEAATILRSRH